MNKNGVRTAAQAVLIVLGVLTAVFAVGALTTSDTPHDDRILIATFGAGMGLFTVALTLAAVRGDQRAWWFLWYLPVFLALHVALLGTWVPDGVLFVLAAAALPAVRPPAGARVEHQATAGHAPGRISPTS